MLITAFIMGLLGSLHCIGMCGPIALMLPVDQKNPRKKAWQTLSYQLGRVLAYALIGAAIGFVGKGFSLFGFQQQLSIVLGVIMILAVVLPYLGFRYFKPPVFTYKLIANIKQKMGDSLRKKTADTFLTIGFLNGFLPCGLVYIAVFASLAADSFWQSVSFMVLFGLGTLPLMSLAVYMSSIIKSVARKKIQRIIPGWIVLMGIWFIIRGMGLGIPYLSPKATTDQVTSTIECHIPNSNNK